MKYINLLILIGITGCASTPGIDITPQQVNVIVPIKCKTPVPPVPNFSFGRLKETDDIFIKSKSLLSDIKLHLAYEDELLAALKSCE